MTWAGQQRQPAAAAVAVAAGSAAGSAAGTPMAAMDLVSLWLDSVERPLNFTAIHRFSAAPPAAAFAEGMASALREFPVSGSRVAPDGRFWLRVHRPLERAFRSLAVAPGPQGESAARTAIQELVDERYDLRSEGPVKQLIVRHGTASPSAAASLAREGAPGDWGSDGELTVATRFHHAACDGASASLWLAHQWQVAFGAAPASPVAPSPADTHALVLRRHGSPARRGPCAPRGPTPTLWIPPSAPERSRQWMTMAVPHQLPERFDARRGPGPSAVMATAFLDALLEWDLARRGRPTALGLWMPVNIRKNPQLGFGNGTSRVRVHGRWASPEVTNPDGRSWEARVSDVGRQIAWSLRHGEWSLPDAGALLGRWPNALTRPLLRAYLQRPWVDMGSAAFTFLPRHALSGAATAWGSRLKTMETVGLLHRRHPVSLIVSDIGSPRDQALQRTATFTYDPGQLSAADVEEIGHGFKARLLR